MGVSQGARVGMRGSRAAMLASVGVVLLVACSGNEATPPRQLPGTYTLRSLGGHPLPAYTPGEPGYRFEIDVGSITLEPNGTFTDSYPWRELNDAGETTRSGAGACSGTWTQTGHDVALVATRTSECDDTGTGVWDGVNTLSIDWASFGGAVAIHTR